MASAPTDSLAAQLEGPSPWHAIEHHEQLDSTNAEASRRAAAGAQAGLVVVADHQTAGRGRRGRSWEDVATGESLLVSFLSGVPPRGLPLVPLAAGVAVSDALRRHGVSPELKWPNDVLLTDGRSGERRKVAGILVEHHAQMEGAPPHLVVGIGVNLDWRGVERDDDTAAWASVAEATGEDVERWDVLADLMRALGTWLRDVPKSPARLLGAYVNRCTTLGAQVRVQRGGAVIAGTAARIDRSGALVVETPEGAVAVSSGEVTRVRRQ